MSSDLILFPPPKNLIRLPGRVPEGEIQETSALGLPESPEAYLLSIGAAGVQIAARTPAGFAAARQTLRQLREQSPDGLLPCLEITDWPDFPVRGYYHDIARGKVPTLATLLALAETCARYKLNHLELYVEHTFAFKNHPEVWKDADPLTAEEIRILDDRCAALHIDLVPSFSTFGHFYPWIHRKFPELNELERDVSGDPFRWWDRMQHYTLDVSNPASLELVREIISEVRPLFRSRYFNICCDETFDLGKGRNSARAEREGTQALYLEFLGKIAQVVRENGAIPLYWADIVGRNPAALEQTPPEAIGLAWNYDAVPTHMREQATLFAASARPFLVCGGSTSWKPAWVPNLAVAHPNLLATSEIGRSYGALGMFVTDWGDFGHVTPLGAALPGLVFGASAAWNGAAARLAEQSLLHQRLSRHLYGDPSGTISALLEHACSASRAQWNMIVWMRQSRPPEFPRSWFDASSHIPDGMFALSASLHEAALKTIQSLRHEADLILDACQCPAPSGPDLVTDPAAHALLIEETRLGLLGLEVMERIYLHAARIAGRADAPVSVQDAETVQCIEQLLASLRRTWLARNKPSELAFLCNTFQGIAQSLAGQGPFALCVPITAPSASPPL